MGNACAAARVARLLLPAAALATSIISLLLASNRPGYDGVAESLSRLGARGAPGSVLFNLALALTALVVVVAGAVLAAVPGRSRIPGMAIAGGGVLLLCAALVPIDGESPATWVHRALTGAVLCTLVIGGSAALGSRYAWLVGTAGLALGTGLLLPSFPGGLWERCVLVLVLGEVELALIGAGRPSVRAPANSAAI